ncbi:MAG: flagellar biosynthesis protein FlhF [Thermodesulfobacteriota bacterium]|nr:flagellar biosynthesis protein FlhF [Thermodesulfobacteriota bacterium]
MQVKIFEAQDMRQALTLIKEEFGPEAVILSSRTLDRQDGSRGVSRAPRVEVTAAMDYHPVAGHDSPQAPFANAHSQRPHSFHLGSANTYASNTHSPVTTPPGAQLHRYGSSAPHRGFQEYPDLLLDFHRHMLTQGVDKEIGLELITSVHSAQPSHRLSEPHVLKQCLVRHLRDKGLKAKVLKLQEGKQTIVPLIGPTGVGKTTTIAKLAAAAHARKQRNSVGLITLDNHRIAAAEQLKIYGNIMGLPVQSLSTVSDLRKAVRIFRDKHLVFVDTAGITKANQDHLKDLGRLFARLHSPQIHLLLSASTKEAALMETVQMAEAIPFARLLFTKLDETSTHGSIFNLVYRTKIPISYFTNGQDIPEGIETATLGKLIHLIMKPQQTGKGVRSIVPRILRGRKGRLDLGSSDPPKYYQAAKH